MSMFRKRKRNVPDLNTSALPDLIFTVLFFFMIVTHMRDIPYLVKAVAPQGVELTKAGKKSAVVKIVIGKAIDGLGQTKGSNGYSIQVNDRLVSIDKLAEAIETERRAMLPEDMAAMVVNIRADKDTPMHIISDVRKILRESHALKVFYTASENKNNS